MPFIFNWHDSEHSIVRVDVIGEATWDDFTRATDQIVAELAKTDHRIDIIFNAQSPMPKGNPLPHVKAANRRIAAFGNKVGLVITVGPRQISSMVKAMVDIMMRVYKFDRSHLGENALTMEAAVDQVNRSRAKQLMLEEIKVAV